MTVGGLAHHLVRQATVTLQLLAASPVEGEPVTLLGHYERAAWVTASLDDDVNVGVREGSNADAAGGPASCAPWWRRPSPSCPQPSGDLVSRRPCTSRGRAGR